MDRRAVKWMSDRWTDEFGCKWQSTQQVIPTRAWMDNSGTNFSNRWIQLAIIQRETGNQYPVGIRPQKVHNRRPKRRGMSPFRPEGSSPNLTSHRAEGDRRSHPREATTLPPDSNRNPHHRTHIFTTRDRLSRRPPHAPSVSIVDQSDGREWGHERNTTHKD